MELVFKRVKSLLGSGLLPQKTTGSSTAWLYGKLLIALLIEKLTAKNFSPHGKMMKVSTRMQNNLWAIFDFVLHAIQQWIMPLLQADKIELCWAMICRRLRNSKRRRKLQMEEWDTVLSQYTT